MNNVELQQEIFNTYTSFPDKDKSLEFNLGMIYAMQKYGIIDSIQAEIAYKYNKQTWIDFE